MGAGHSSSIMLSGSPNDVKASMPSYVSSDVGLVKNMV